jgi:hypothetical protein
MLQNRLLDHRLTRSRAHIYINTTVFVFTVQGAKQMVLVFLFSCFDPDVHFHYDFLINVGIRVILCVPRLIPRALKLTTM